MSSTRISRRVNAPRANIYRALLDAQAVATWMVPTGMTSHVHEFDAREGGSRPHTSNDNPYSEAHFKTLKYHPEFPDRFNCLPESRTFCHGFFGWYNTEHRHSALGLLTPETVHFGRTSEVLRYRTDVLLTAFNQHPHRFKGRCPQPKAPPNTVYINPPREQLTHKELP